LGFIFHEFLYLKRIEQEFWHRKIGQKNILPDLDHNI